MGSVEYSARPRWDGYEFSPLLGATLALWSWTDMLLMASGLGEEALTYDNL